MRKAPDQETVEEALTLYNQRLDSILNDRRRSNRRDSRKTRPQLRKVRDEE